MFGKLVSDLQSDVEIGGGAIDEHGEATYSINGTLNYVDDYTEFSSNPAEQDGNFIALTLVGNDFSNLTSVKIGLQPTYKSGSPVDDESGLVELINDPDKNGVFRISDHYTQVLKVKYTNGTKTKTDIYSLSGLTCLDS